MTDQLSPAWPGAIVCRAAWDAGRIRQRNPLVTAQCCPQCCPHAVLPPRSAAPTQCCPHAVLTPVPPPSQCCPRNPAPTHFVTVLCCPQYSSDWFSFSPLAATAQWGSPRARCGRVRARTPGRGSQRAGRWPGGCCRSCRAALPPGPRPPPRPTRPILRPSGFHPLCDGAVLPPVLVRQVLGVLPKP
jgi:hypothetical protein